MLGDLVIFGCCYWRIDGIKQGKINFKGDPSYLWLSVDDVEPIPLTAEILEKNGFEFDDESSSWAVCERYLLHGHKAMWSVVFGDELVPVNYVHELQHALRLCGLDYIADNFKIE